MSKEKLKEVINSCLLKVANGFSKAVNEGDISKQKHYIKQAQTIGVYVEKDKHKLSSNVLELHSPSPESAGTLQQSHMAFFDAKNEMLLERSHIGIQVPSDVSDNTTCLWAEQGSVSTLNKTSVSVPE